MSVDRASWEARGDDLDFAARARHHAFMLIDHAEEIDRADVRQYGERLRDLALILEIPGDTFEPAQLRAEINRLRREAAARLREIMA